MADAFSYWMRKLMETNGISYATVIEQDFVPLSCPIDLDVSEYSSLNPLGLENFIAPLLIFGAFIVLAVLTRTFRMCFKHRLSVVKHVRRGALGKNPCMDPSISWQRAVEASESTLQQQLELRSRAIEASETTHRLELAVQGINAMLNLQQKLMVRIVGAHPTTSVGRSGSEIGSVGAATPKQKRTMARAPKPPTIGLAEAAEAAIVSQVSLAGAARTSSADSALPRRPSTNAAQRSKPVAQKGKVVIRKLSPPHPK